MEIPNLNCKWCEYQTELWREHCAECLFNLEQTLKEENQLTLEWADHETCESCNYKNKTEECKDCIYLALKKDKWNIKQNHVKDAEHQ